MKKLQELTGVKTLSKKEQQAVKGGIKQLHPCGEAGGVISNNPDVWCDVVFNGVCWICR
ncbi:hypothetical protein EV201_2682 [Ancylomarina subtilis]|uniref:Uncharacterized protein n=1 Tax=Ancylomarina subtilis TaxID=1639035 RepID=A0A4Q7VEE6_9BACT|nr:hypothetical protein [Ancylomarina subtilis]RZT93512.1 hypothetical protein EV201_2682 [Ancylomarina subtilis]